MVKRPPATATGQATGQWRDTIVGYDAAVDPATLRAHPGNARHHGDAQRAAIRQTIAQVGWVAPVVVNKRSGNIVDGHARVELAAEAGERVPVVWVDLDADTERQVLATFDPLGYMAEVDAGALADLLAGMGSVQDDLDRMLASMAGVELTVPFSPAAVGAAATYADPATPAYEPTAAAFPVEAEEGFSAGAVGVRAIVLTYDVDTYAKVMAALGNVPGESNADKVKALLGVG